MVRLPSAIRFAGCTSFLVLASVSGIAQNANISIDDYSTVLQQISDQKILIAQRELFIEKQKSDMAFMREQIAAVGPATQGFDAMVSKIAAQAEDAINNDVPFRLEERQARIQKLKADIADVNLRPDQKYRRALAALSIEVNYGFDIESYPGERPLNDGEVPTIVSTLNVSGEEMRDENTNEIVMGPEMGDFLRYGRMALVYLDQRTTNARRFDSPTKTWVDIKGDELLEVRRAVRISKGQSAPAVLVAPVYKASE